MPRRQLTKVQTTQIPTEY